MPSTVNQQGILDVVQKDFALWEAKAFKNTLSSSRRDQTRYFSFFSVSDVHSVESWSTPGVKDFLKHQLMLQCQKRPLHSVTVTVNSPLKYRECAKY